MKQPLLGNFFSMNRTLRVQMTFDNSYLLYVSKIEGFIYLVLCQFSIIKQLLRRLHALGPVI